MKPRARLLVIVSGIVLLFGIIALVIKLFHARGVEAVWYNNSWPYRVKLTIDHSKVTADQTDFPVYVDLSLLPAQFHQYVNQTDARDIRVTTGDGTTELPREVVYYTAATNTGELYVKYSGTLSSSTDTSIYIYYGNASASDYAVTDANGTQNVWDSNYEGVWHFNETSGTHYDSTANNNDSASLSLSTQGGTAIAKFGGADTFNGTTSYINVGSSTTLDFATNATLEAWIYPVGWGEGGYGSIVARGAGSNVGYEYYTASARSSLSLWDVGRSDATNNAITLSTWQHAVVAVDNNVAAFYVNATAQGGSAFTLASSGTTTAYIGSIDGAADTFNGTMDEMRLSSIARSSTWISTQYNNQNAPSTFFTVGTAEGQTQVRAIVNFAFDEGYGTTTRDASSNAYTGTLTGATPPSWQPESLCIAGKCLYYEGSTAYTNVATSIANVKSVSFWVKPKTNSETLVDFDGGTHYITATNGTITASGFDTPTVYVNGVSGGLLVANAWQHVEVTTATSFTASNITIGKKTAFLNGFLDEFRLYDYARSAAQVKSDYVSRNSQSGANVRFGPDAGKNLSNGLVAYWKMDENTGSNAFDSSGNGNTQVLTGMSSDWTSGKFGSTLNFSGSGHEAKSTQTFSTVSQGTFAAWIYPTSIGATYRTIIASGDDAGTDRFIWLDVTDGGNVQFYVRENGSSNEYAISTTTTLSANTWYHIAASQSDTGPKIYINGVLQTTAVDVQTGTADGTEFFDDVAGIDNTTLGYRDRNTNSDYFVGKIDEVRVYNRALSPAEVSQLYTWAAGPVGWWKMDEQTGSYANDSSGYGNQGTLAGGTSWATGKYGAAVAFDGADSTTITAGSGASLDDLPAMTLEAWVYVRGYGAGSYARLVDKAATNTPGSGYEIDLSSSGIVNFENACTSGTVQKSVNPAFSLNQWTHIVLTYDGSANSSGVNWYINGVLTAGTAEHNCTSGSPVSNASQNFIIGNSTASDRAFNGFIDDVRVYNYIRSSSQILEDMNGGDLAISNPVGYWKFDEGYGTTANDNSISANTLTLSAAGWTNSGKFTNAYDGATNRRLTRSDDTDFDFSNGTDEFTISVWFNRGGAISNAEYLVDKHSTNDGFTLYMDADGDIVCGIGDGTSFPEDTAGTTAANYDDTSWHHAVCVKNGTTSLTLYVDGKEVASDTSIGANGDMSNSGKLIIGDTNETDGTDEWLGDIDELRIYRAALPLEQIKLLYNQGGNASLGGSSVSLDSYCPPGQSTTCVGPLGYWPFNENTGGEGVSIGDVSGNGYNLSVTGWNASYWNTGKIGSGLHSTDANGVIQNGTIVDPASGALDFSDSQDYTLGLWVKFISKENSSFFLIHKGAQANNAPGYNMGVNSSYQVYCTYADTDVGAYDIATGTTVLSDANWHYASCVMDRDGSEMGTAGLYVLVDGVIEGSDTSFDEGSGAGSSSDFRVGETDASWEFEAYIDEIKLYNYARTPAQIMWDMNRGAPVGWWKFDECTGDTLYDASVLGSGATGGKNGTRAGTSGTNTSSGSCTGSSTEARYNGATGKFNASLDFDGGVADADDKVTITNATAIDLNTGLQKGFTFSAWIYPESDGEGDAGRIFDKGNTYCRLATDTTVSCTVDLATDEVFSATTLLTLNAWNHVAFSWTNDADDEVTIWVNGVANTSVAKFAGDAAAESTDLTIGNIAAQSATFDGKIDDVRVYNYELTAQQIKTVMNGGAVRF